MKQPGPGDLIRHNDINYCFNCQHLPSVTLWLPKWRSPTTPEKVTNKASKRVTRKNQVCDFDIYNGSVHMCIHTFDLMTLCNIYRIQTKGGYHMKLKHFTYVTYQWYTVIIEIYTRSCFSSTKSLKSCKLRVLLVNVPTSWLYLGKKSNQAIQPTPTSSIHKGDR